MFLVSHVASRAPQPPSAWLHVCVMYVLTTPYVVVVVSGMLSAVSPFFFMGIFFKRVDTCTSIVKSVGNQCMQMLNNRFDLI